MTQALSVACHILFTSHPFVSSALVRLLFDHIIHTYSRHCFCLSVTSSMKLLGLSMASGWVIGRGSKLTEITISSSRRRAFKQESILNPFTNVFIWTQRCPNVYKNHLKDLYLVLGFMVYAMLQTNLAPCPSALPACHSLFVHVQKSTLVCVAGYY